MIEQEGASKHRDTPPEVPFPGLNLDRESGRVREPYQDPFIEGAEVINQGVQDRRDQQTNGADKVKQDTETSS